MAVKNLKQNSSAATYHNGISPFNFPDFFSSIVPMISWKYNSGTEESGMPSVTPVTSTRQKKFWKLQRIFCQLDEDGDGKLSSSELRSCLCAMGEELSLEEVEEAVNASDTDGDGELGFEDFIKLVAGDDDDDGDDEDDLKKEKRLMEAYRMYENGDRGCITPDSLCRMLKRLGENHTVDDYATMIDGSISTGMECSVLKSLRS